MAHDRNIAKLTKDMKENAEKFEEQLRLSDAQGKAAVTELQGRYDALL